MAELICFRTGSRRHSPCMAIAGTGALPRTFHSHAYLIKTASGLILFDTGLAPRFHNPPARGVYRLYPFVIPATCATPLRAQLTAYGADPDAVHVIVVSHFHADQIAGLRDFPAARIICRRDAWEAVRHPRGLSALRHGILADLLPTDLGKRLQMLESSRESMLPAELKPFRWGVDLGDGELFAVALPGHAEGQTGLFVKGADGWTLLAAEAASHHDSLLTNRVPSLLGGLAQHDRHAYRRTLDQLRTMRRAAIVRIRLTHDDTPDFPSKAGQQ